MKLHPKECKKNGFTITSLMVSCSLIGLMLPVVHRIALIPVTTQAKAANFQEAESSATMFTAAAIKSKQLGSTPSNCSVDAEDEEKLVYTITCTEGASKSVRATVARTFTLINPNNTAPGNGNNRRHFTYDAPEKYSQHLCPVTDQWGVQGYNDQWAESLGGWCIPYPAWDKEWYRASNPDDWMYDINNFNGWGYHPGYE